MSDSLPIAKKCRKCGIEKPLNDFSPCKTTNDGHRCTCRACNEVRKREWRAANRDKINGYNEKYISKNPRHVWAYHTINHHIHKGNVVNVTIKELETVAMLTEKCPICGCDIDWNLRQKGGIKPNSPSWDRKYNGSRLTLQNTWILCHHCNSMKLDMPLPELVEWCRMVVSKFGGQ